MTSRLRSGVLVLAIAAMARTASAQSTPILGVPDVPRRRSLGNVASVPPHVARLSFAIAGTQPVRDVVRFRFDLQDAALAVIRVFDVTGRLVGPVIDGAFSAGSNEIAWDAHSLPPGVYHARLSVGTRTESVRLVRAQ